jgi:hypothetical protein
MMLRHIADDLKSRDPSLFFPGVDRSSLAGCRTLIRCHVVRLVRAARQGSHCPWPLLSQAFLHLAGRCGPEESELLDLEERSEASNELAVAWRCMPHHVFYAESRGNFCRIVQQVQKSARSGGRTPASTGASGVDTPKTDADVRDNLCTFYTLVLFNLLKVHNLY